MLKICLNLSFYLLCTYIGYAQTSSTINIISKPIVYNQERIQLSIDYLKQRHNLIQSTATITPKIIVLHYTAGGTLESNFNYFNNVKIEGARAYNKNQSPLNVSSHYLVDRDGSIYQLMPDTFFARHTIGLNYCAIGIENIGSKAEPLTEEQAIANAKLVRHLKSKFAISHLIGHYEYGKFKGTKLWRETNPSYFTGKDDPGSDFMVKVRSFIKDLKLKYTP
jgi:N-acetylmuramoyl-L-alanine amidase